MKRTAASATAGSTRTGLAYETSFASWVSGAYPAGSDFGSSRTSTAEPRPTGTARVPATSVVNGLPGTGAPFSVTAMATPTAGAHLVGSVPPEKNDVSASVPGASAQCNATTARSVGSPPSEAESAWASAAAEAKVRDARGRGVIWIVATKASTAAHARARCLIMPTP